MSSRPRSKKNDIRSISGWKKPKLSKNFRKRIDRIFYSISKFGIDEVALYEGYSVFDFYNHIRGRLLFIKQIDQDKWEVYNKNIEKIFT